MEEKKKKSTPILICLVVILVLVALGEYYFLVIKKDTSKEKKEDTNIVDNKPSTINTNVTKEQVNKLFEDGIKTYLSNSEWTLNMDNQKFTSEDEKLEWIMLTNSYTKIEFESDLCNSEIGKKLMEDKLTLKPGVGQTSCENDIFIKGDSAIEAVKQVFGKDAEFNIKNIGKNGSRLFTYHEKYNLIYMLIAGQRIPTTPTLLSYSFDSSSNILTLDVEFNTNNEKSNHIITYTVDGNNFYLKSIEKK